VMAKEIHHSICDALGLSDTAAADDKQLAIGIVANMTTDTAAVSPSAVMPKTAKILSEKYRMFRGLSWTPCSCHVLNLFLVDQERAFKSIKAVIATGKLIVAIFRNSAPRKLFQRCGLLLQCGAYVLTLFKSGTDHTM
jgi:hypothetical protein